MDFNTKMFVFVICLKTFIIKAGNKKRRILFLWKWLCTEDNFIISKNFELRPGPWMQIRDQANSSLSKQSQVSNSWEDTFNSKREIPFKKVYQALGIPICLAHILFFCPLGYSFVHYFWRKHWTERAAWEIPLLHSWKVCGCHSYKWYRVVKEKNRAVSALHGL